MLSTFMLESCYWHKEHQLTEFGCGFLHWTFEDFQNHNLGMDIGAFCKGINQGVSSEGQLQHRQFVLILSVDLHVSWHVGLVGYHNAAYRTLS